MRNYNLTREEGEVVAQTQDELYKALFGSINFPRNLSIFWVCFSILMATFILHDGWFPTSRSQGMTNYHRWLYDLYVVISLMTIPLVYLRFKQQKAKVSFRRKWNAYIRAYAQYNVKLKEVIATEELVKSRQQKLTDSMIQIFFKNKWFQYVTIFLIIYGCIAMYIWVTPFVSTRGSSFWILTWWPINACFIAALYYMQFPLLIRWLSIDEIQTQTEKLSNKYPNINN